MGDLKRTTSYKVSKERKEQLFAEPKRQTPEQRAFVKSVLMAPMDYAVKVAEGNKKNFGAVGAKNPQEAQQILTNSIRNNYLRWQQAGSPGKFVDFMADRWAPIGVANDPKNLNVNWTPNVRDALKRKLGPEEYKRWQLMNLVRLQNMNQTMV